MRHVVLASDDFGGDTMVVDVPLWEPAPPAADVDPPETWVPEATLPYALPRSRIVLNLP